MPMDALLDQFPKTEESASARTLDEMIMRLGMWRIEWDPRFPSSTATKEDQAALDAITTYAKRLDTLRIDASLAAPPAIVDDYLRRHAADIAAVEEHLTTAPPPVYATDLGHLPGAPFPSLIGLRQLESVLIVRAVLADARGDAAATARALDAARREIAALTPRHELLSQLMVVAFGQMENGALRLLHGAPEGWADLIGGADPRVALRRGLQADAFYWNQVARRDGGYSDLMGVPPDHHFTDAVTTFLTRPYGRLSVVEANAAMLAGVQYAEHKGLCEIDSNALEQAMRGHVSWWNRFGSMTSQGFAREWDVTRDHMLSSELTRLVIEARAHRKEAGDWPVTGTVPSKVCASLSWVYERDGDRLRIRPAAAPPPIPGDKTERPWPFTLSPERER
jgi:hypothetical protein